MTVYAHENLLSSCSQIAQRFIVWFFSIKIPFIDAVDAAVARCRSAKLLNIEFGYIGLMLVVFSSAFVCLFVCLFVC